jgi:Phasin protein
MSFEFIATTTKGTCNRLPRRQEISRKPTLTWHQARLLPLRQQIYEDQAMAKDRDPSESLAATATRTTEQVTKQTQDAMQNYLDWLQMTMSGLPWSYTNLNRILLSNATQNITATFAFMHKLSQAKNFQEVVKIQTEFMENQMNSFSEQAKILGETYTKAAEDAVKAPFGTRK